ncbi:MAG: energy-coupling factor transporter transmembrane component T family protein [Candidatus Ranarchaeia archaeon]|jgi:energy-coupling factor transport system permease protein
MSSAFILAKSFVYVDRDSPVHRLDPRTKFTITGVITLLCWIRPVGDLFGLLLDFSIATALAGIYVAKAQITKELLPLIKTYGVFTLITFPLLFLIYGIFPPYTVDPNLLHLLEPIFTLIGPNAIFPGGIILSVYSILYPTLILYRLVIMMVIWQVFLLTTNLDDLELLLVSFKLPYWFVLTLSFTFRFIPTLVDEAIRISDAQILRGLDVESGNILSRWYRRLVPLLLPLLVSALRRSIRFAEALETRAFLFQPNRTSLKKLRLSKTDGFLIGSFLVLIGWHILGILFPMITQSIVQIIFSSFPL